jgi:hypothetical protein
MSHLLPTSARSAKGPRESRTFQPLRNPPKGYVRPHPHRCPGRLRRVSVQFCEASVEGNLGPAALGSGQACLAVLQGSECCHAPGRVLSASRGHPIRFNPAIPQRGVALDRRGGLLDVEVDAEEQERPQHDCQQR